MYPVQQLSDDPFQRETVVLADGSQVTLTIQYRPLQQGWWVTELTYQSFTLENLRISNSPNLLHQFCNQIPFGLACFSTTGREPSLQQDFSSGASALYILTAAEVLTFKEYLAGE